MTKTVTKTAAETLEVGEEPELGSTELLDAGVRLAFSAAKTIADTGEEHLERASKTLQEGLDLARTQAELLGYDLPEFDGGPEEIMEAASAVHADLYPRTSLY